MNMLRKRRTGKITRPSEPQYATQTPAQNHSRTENYDEDEDDHHSRNRTEYIEHTGTSSASPMSRLTFQTITVFPRSAEPTPAPHAVGGIPNSAIAEPMPPLFPSQPVAPAAMVHQQYLIDSAIGFPTTPLGMRRVRYQATSAIPMTRWPETQNAVSNPTSSPPPFPHPNVFNIPSDSMSAVSLVQQVPSNNAPAFPLPVLSYSPAPSPSIGYENTNPFPSFPPVPSFGPPDLVPPSLQRPTHRPLPQVQTPLSRPVIPPGPIAHPFPRSIPPELPTVPASPLTVASLSLPPSNQSPIQAESLKDLEPTSSELSLLRELGQGEDFRSQVALEVNNNTIPPLTEAQLNGNSRQAGFGSVVTAIFSMGHILILSSQATTSDSDPAVHSIITYAIVITSLIGSLLALVAIGVANRLPTQTGDTADLDVDSPPVGAPRSEQVELHLLRSLKALPPIGMPQIYHWVCIAGYFNCFSCFVLMFISVIARIWHTHRWLFTGILMTIVCISACLLIASSSFAIAELGWVGLGFTGRRRDDELYEDPNEMVRDIEILDDKQDDQQADDGQNESIFSNRSIRPSRRPMLLARRKRRMKLR